MTQFILDKFKDWLNYKIEKLEHYVASIEAQFSNCSDEQEYQKLMQRFAIIFYFINFSLTLKCDFLESLLKKQFINLFKEEFTYYHKRIKHQKQINHYFYEFFLTLALESTQKEVFYFVWQAYLERNPTLTYAFFISSLINNRTTSEYDNELGNSILESYLGEEYKKERLSYHLLLSGAFLNSNYHIFKQLLLEHENFLHQEHQKQEIFIKHKIDTFNQDNDELIIYNDVLSLGLNFQRYELLYCLIEQLKSAPILSQIQSLLLNEVASSINIKQLEEERLYKYYIDDILSDELDTYQKNIFSLACSKMNIDLVRLILQYKLVSDLQIKDEMQNNSHSYLIPIFDALKEQQCLLQSQRNETCHLHAKEEWIKQWGSDKQKADLLTSHIKKEVKQTESKQRRKI